MGRWWRRGSWRGWRDDHLRDCPLSLMDSLHSSTQRVGRPRSGNERLKPLARAVRRGGEILIHFKPSMFFRARLVRTRGIAQ